MQIPLAIDGRITHRSFALVGIVGLAALAFTVATWWRNARRCVEFRGVGLAICRCLAGCWPSCRWGRLLSTAAAPILRLRRPQHLRHEGPHPLRFRHDSRRRFSRHPTSSFQSVLPAFAAVGGGSNLLDARKLLRDGTEIAVPVFSLVACSVYAGQLRRFGARGLAAAFALMLLLMPICLDCFEGAGLSGSADFPLAALIFTGVLELSRWIRRPGWRPAVCAALSAGRGCDDESGRLDLDRRLRRGPGRHMAVATGLADGSSIAHGPGRRCGVRLLSGFGKPFCISYPIRRIIRRTSRPSIGSGSNNWAIGRPSCCVMGSRNCSGQSSGI